MVAKLRGVKDESRDVRLRPARLRVSKRVGGIDVVDSSDQYATYATFVSLEMCRVANVERRCGRVWIRSRLAAQAERNVEG